MGDVTEVPGGIAGDVVVSLPTTVVGSFPKPRNLDIPDWFAMGAVKPGLLGTSTEAYTRKMCGMSEADAARLEENLLEATREILAEQHECGVDVVTDGEVRRENYIHYLCRQINGIDFERLTEASVRNGAFTARLPTITGEVTWRGPLNCAEEWGKAQALSKTPVKYTLPGPMTIMGSTYDAHYGDEVRLASDLAAIVNHRVLELAAAGCKHIQVDEPLFARKPEEALRYGVRMLERCFADCPAGVDKSVHMCCGYPGYVDQTNYLKADPNAYLRLAPALDASCVDSISIEAAWCRCDFSQLLPLFKKKRVILGAINVSSSRIESVEEVRAQLEEALRYIEPTRLVIAPDCGLALLDGEHRAKLRPKLTNMCAAARSVRVPQMAVPPPPPCSSKRPAEADLPGEGSQRPRLSEGGSEGAAAAEEPGGERQ
eukprot:NODE_4721_length_1856_cov_3.386350.p1 GENE.NODE_4721_length_1856_cov_3.386350~~NODE_4721_length_1856_cov_3.386350.p1  ORF type:complete len:430 (-),score=140.17 NODE_4721_length_1856_cov_3.386350:490-1779(-)